MTDTEAAVDPSVRDAQVLSDISQFLYHEADLLDAWRLDEWLALMTEDIRYRVPAPGFEIGPAATTMQVVHDGRTLLAGRVTRLKSKHAHAESPKSHTRRMLSNVRAAQVEGCYHVRSNFHILRTRLDHLDHFVGHYLHVLVPVDGEPGQFRVRERVATLDHDLVAAGGTVSILL